MAKNVDILVLDDPLIELEELSVDDYESGTDNQSSTLKNNSVRSNTTNVSPIIKINDFIVNASYLQEFEIDCTGFVPECSVTFFDVTGEFSELNYPKDGDLMKVYIGSGGKEDTWKPIRIDFQILDIEPFTEDGVNGFNISGDMEIPSFELEKCEVYKEMSSFDACRAISKNLKLGFSSNIQGTDDVQTWINNYGTDKNLLNKIIKHSYKDENSFMTMFIDPYYYVNFVECNAIINDADNDDRTISQLDEIKYISDMINADPDFKDVEENTAPDFITNSNTYLSSNIGIISFGQVNRCSSITQNIGKKIYTRYWDDNEEEYRVEFITPFISEGQNLLQMTQSENNEKSVKENTKKLIMRAQTDNMHKNYNYSEICNRLNLQEIEKYGINVTLAGFNPQIMRYQKKYVAIYSHSYFAAMDVDSMNADNSEERKSDEVLNPELSGFYTVTGISYSLVDGYLTTNLEMRKRAIKTYNM